MRSSTLSRILGILVVAIVVGGLIGWWASRNPTKTEFAPLPPVPEPTTGQSTKVPVPRVIVTNETGALVSELVDTNAFDPALWDDKLDEILGDPDDNTDRKGRQLLEMMDKVGTEAQAEIAGHIINLIGDADYPKTAKYLTNAEVPEAVSSVFMNDLYNRDELVKMPLLLAVARNEKHALREEAKDLLELYVEEDYGTDWNKWEEATKKYIKEHGGEVTPEPPAEPAPAQP